MMDETTESSSRREKKQNIMSKGCTIVLFWDFVIYERTLSSQRALNTVKFPEWRKFSVKKDSARKRWKRKKSISLYRYCCCATRQTCLRNLSSWDKALFDLFKGFFFLSVDIHFLLALLFWGLKALQPPLCRLANTKGSLLNLKCLLIHLIYNI